MGSRQQAGFTLGELMVTLAIMAVLMAIAAPAMLRLRESIQATTAMHQLTAALATARMEAVRRNHPVTVCPSSDGLRCRGDQVWGLGWIVFKDAVRTGQPRSGDILQIFDGPGPGMDVQATPGRLMVRFSPDGWSAGSNISLRLCGLSGMPRLLGSVVVNNAGRPRSERAAPGRPCPFRR